MITSHLTEDEASSNTDINRDGKEEINSVENRFQESTIQELTVLDVDKTFAELVSLHQAFINEELRIAQNKTFTALLNRCLYFDEEFKWEELEASLLYLKARNINYIIYLYPENNDALAKWFAAFEERKRENPHSILHLVKLDEIEDIKKNWRKSTQRKTAEEDLQAFFDKHPERKANFEAALAKDKENFKQKHQDVPEESITLHVYTEAIDVLSWHQKKVDGQKRPTNINMLMYNHKITNAMYYLISIAGKLRYWEHSFKQVKSKCKNITIAGYDEFKQPIPINNDYSPFQFNQPVNNQAPKVRKKKKFKNIVNEDNMPATVTNNEEFNNEEFNNNGFKEAKIPEYHAQVDAAVDAIDVAMNTRSSEFVTKLMLKSFQALAIAKRNPHISPPEERNMTRNGRNSPQRSPSPPKGKDELSPSSSPPKNSAFIISQLHTNSTSLPGVGQSQSPPKSPPNANPILVTGAPNLPPPGSLPKNSLLKAPSPLPVEVQEQNNKVEYRTPQKVTS